MSILVQIKQSLKQEIEAAAAKTGLVSIEEIPEVVLELPKEKAHGDFSTNMAMQLTKIAKKNPREIAEQIKQSMNMTKAGVTKIEIAGPGFINFFMDRSFLHQVIPEVLQARENYGRIQLESASQSGQSVPAGQAAPSGQSIPARQARKIQVEFVSANPTGSLHLGHARGAAVGDALCNLLTYAGHEVTREYYINDGGNQILNLAKSIEARYLQALGEQVEMPEDGYHGEDIKGFAQDLVEQEGERLLTLTPGDRQGYFLKYGLEKELEKLKFDLDRFGVSFDVWFSESTLYQDGQIDAVLEELKQREQIFEEEGATWLRTTPYGDDKDRVLIKNDGSYTYLTPDIAYHKNKFSRGFDQLINIWGADHHGYIPRVKAAMMALGYESERLTVLIAQMVSLFQNGEKVKMSKRTGKAVTMKDLMDEVGIDAIRYFFTMRGMDAHLDFDMDLAISKSNENPVFYVQYAHARICSIFKQAEEQGVERLDIDKVDLSLLDKEAEYDLLLKLAELSEEIRVAAEQYAPHRMVRYVYDLAAQFHSYYRAERVIVEDVQITQARLALLEAIQIVIRNVLKLIGVSAPESM